MAKDSELKTVKITINGQELEALQGELVVEAAKRLGVDIPIFCYHPRMEPVGMCRMCLVEVGAKQPDGTIRKMPKPQTACTLPASEGLVINTDTEQVHKDRKGVLEFLLINHPLDCPICDRGGECPLQNNTQFYGPSTSRYTEEKRRLPKAYPLSKHVTLDLERCIQCGRCVRFTEEISGDHQLAFLHRGAEMHPSTFNLLDFESKFSGNTIEICPVGALTNTNYRFRARPWDLETSKAVCLDCSNGCNLWLDHRNGKLVRVNGRTNESVNEEWTCDRGKFGQNVYQNSKRLTVPLMRENGAFVETDWSHAYKQINEVFKSGSAGALIKPNCSNEALYLMQKLFHDAYQSQNIDYRWTKVLPKDDEAIHSSTIASFEDRKSIFIFGSLLEEELPILYLRIRKAWKHHAIPIILATDRSGYVDSFADIILRYRTGTEAVLALGLLHEAFPELKNDELAQLTPAVVEDITGVSAALLRKAAELVVSAAPGIVTTTQLMNHDHFELIQEVLWSLAIQSEGTFDRYPVESNQKGAEAISSIIRKNDHLNTAQILQAAAEGKMKALWLVGANPLQDFHDKKLAEQALERVDFLVYQGSEESEVMGYASVVLPMCAPAEQCGTYTNIEGRVQQMSQALHPHGKAKPDWQIFNEVLSSLGNNKPFYQIDDVMKEMITLLPCFKKISFDDLKKEGSLLTFPSKKKLSKNALKEALTQLNQERW